MVGRISHTVLITCITNSRLFLMFYSCFLGLDKPSWLFIFIFVGIKYLGRWMFNTFWHNREFSIWCVWLLSLPHHSLLCYGLLKGIMMMVMTHCGLASWFINITSGGRSYLFMVVRCISWHGSSIVIFLFSFLHISLVGSF